MIFKVTGYIHKHTFRFREKPSKGNNILPMNEKLSGTLCYMISEDVEFVSEHMALANPEAVVESIVALSRFEILTTNMKAILLK